MIISASRRTDVPAFYSEWLFKRFREGYTLVRNPYNNQVSKIDLSPDVVDAIVFWTKNPVNMISRIHELAHYAYYFQYTLNAYGQDIEKHVPSKNDVIIPAFQQLSDKIGKEKVVWRYDPVFFNEKYTLDYHVKYFNLLANKLADYTEKCTISFIDMYKHIEERVNPLKIGPGSKQQQIDLIGKFSEIAIDHGIYIDLCAENVDFGQTVRHAKCIDQQRLERIGDYKLDVGKDSGQRKNCGCVASIDIGAYNTCLNQCVYCYASNQDNSSSKGKKKLHKPDSPLLFGDIGPEEVIKEKTVKSNKQQQVSLFDL